MAVNPYKQRDQGCNRNVFLTATGCNSTPIGKSATGGVMHTYAGVLQGVLHL